MSDQESAVPDELVDGPAASAPDIQPAPESVVDIEEQEPQEEPRAARPHLFECGRPSHLQRGSGEIVTLNRETGQLVARSGPVCSRCYIEWIGKRFRTKDTGKEAPLPEGVEG